MFKPIKIYYEKNIVNYRLGQLLLEKYKNVDKKIIDNHNNILELRENSNSFFPIMKKYLIIGVRKSLRFVPNYKVSNYLVPYTSSGCSAMCLYCYLVCHYNKCSYLRLFVNREEMLDKIIKAANKSENDLIFEIGSNSDLILENTITGNLVWTIEKFSQNNKGYLTFPTKFSYVDPILKLNHNGRIIVRVSMNPKFIIRNIELGTSNLDDRINAINKLCDAGYKIGILIAPVIMLDNWKMLYKELIEYLFEKLSIKVKEETFFEVIFMTYSFVHDKINTEAFPKSLNLYDKEKMIGRGMGKYAYRESFKNDGELYIRELLGIYFPNNRIIYVC